MAGPEEPSIHFGRHRGFVCPHRWQAARQWSWVGFEVLEATGVKPPPATEAANPDNGIRGFFIVLDYSQQLWGLIGPTEVI
jgi:hypothetical protein